MKIEVTNAFEKKVYKITSKKVKEALLEVIKSLKSAENLSQIQKIKPIIGHKNYYRIIVAERYRLGIKLENNIVWLLFFGIRNERTYKLFP